MNSPTPLKEIDEAELDQSLAATSPTRTRAAAPATAAPAIRIPRWKDLPRGVTTKNSDVRAAVSPWSEARLLSLMW